MVPKFNSGSTSLDGSSIDLVGVSLSEAIVDVVGDSDGFESPVDSLEESTWNGFNPSLCQGY